jgi:hypothetical protein
LGGEKVKGDVNASCQSSDECKSNRCVNNYCATATENGYCQASSDCDTGLICFDTKCVKPNPWCPVKPYLLVFTFIGAIGCGLATYFGYGKHPVVLTKLDWKAELTVTAAVAFFLCIVAFVFSLFIGPC